MTAKNRVTPGRIQLAETVHRRANSITVSGEATQSQLDNVIITTTAGSPTLLQTMQNVNLQLSGATKLTAPAKKAGIEVPQGCELSISGDGSIVSTGGKSAAGIGASGSDTASEAGSLGKIVIFAGTIAAIGGSNGAGIGDGQNGQGGGEITIYGGSIFAKRAEMEPESAVAVLQVIRQNLR